MPRKTLVALCSLALVGWALRLRALDAPPFDFHPTRQYYALIFADDLRHTLCGDPASPEAQAARENRRDEALLEPPLLPAVGALGGCIAGRDAMSPVARGLIALVWCLGALAAGALAEALGATLLGAALCAAWMLFHPYAFAAGRSFQPDAPMVALLLFASWQWVTGLQRVAPRRVEYAALAFGLAVLVKLVAIFLAAGVMAGGLIATRCTPTGFVRRYRRAVWVGLAAITPAALWYADGFFGHGFLRTQSQGRFQPHLLTTQAFWDALALRVDAVTGLGAFWLSLGLATLTAGRAARAVTLGWLAGQLALGLVFTFHIYTHDYYNLPLIPFAGLGLGLGVSALERALARHTPRLALGAVTALGLGAAALSGRAVRDAWRDAASAVSAGQATVVDAASVGARVRHTPHVLVQAPWYGLALKFTGQFAAEYWPEPLDITEESPMLSPAERAARRYKGEVFRYFVLGDAASLGAQPALAAWLGATHSCNAEGRRSRVYRRNGL